MDIERDPIYQINQNDNLEIYRAVGKLVKTVLNKLKSEIRAGGNICELTKLGDQMINQELSKIFNWDISKTIGFPTSISKSHMAGHWAPPPSYQNNPEVIINPGELIKVECGAQIDGFPVVACTTIWIPSTQSDQSTQHTQTDELDESHPAARTILAAHKAMNEVLSHMKPGKPFQTLLNSLKRWTDRYQVHIPWVKENRMKEITMSTEEGDEWSTFTEDASAFSKRVPGMHFYQVSKGIIDGFNFPELAEYPHMMIPTQTAAGYNFDQELDRLSRGEVYTVDVVAVSGKSGRLKRSDQLSTASNETNSSNASSNSSNSSSELLYGTTIYKKNGETYYNLKLKAARDTLNTIRGPKGEQFPVNVGNKIMESRWRFGLKECLNHSVVIEYPVWQTTSGEYIARYKATVIVDDRPIVLAGRPDDSELKYIKKESKSKRRKRNNN